MFLSGVKSLTLVDEQSSDVNVRPVKGDKSASRPLPTPLPLHLRLRRFGKARTGLKSRTSSTVMPIAIMGVSGILPMGMSWNPGLRGLARSPPPYLLGRGHGGHFSRPSIELPAFLRGFIPELFFRQFIDHRQRFDRVQQRAVAPRVEIKIQFLQSHLVKQRQVEDINISTSDRAEPHS